jgi:hypothetical protein
MGCADRHVIDGKTCHATCAAYAEWKCRQVDYNNRYNDAQSGRIMVESILATGAAKTLRKNRRAKRHFLFNKGGA